MYSLTQFSYLVLPNQVAMFLVLVDFRITAISVLLKLVAFRYFRISVIAVFPYFLE